jgi:hypothetical protein
MGNKPGAWLQLFVIGCVPVLAPGCSIYHDLENPFWVTANASGKPTVWQCTVVTMASPPQYACPDGKTYTASQLRASRLSTETPNVNNK